MVSTRFALVGALAGAARANWANTTGIHYTTEVVTELTTYCPAPTTITHGSQTYTVTEPTTLTITDCPCTISKPVVPTHPPTPPKDECAEKCSKAYDECRVAPDANMATCAAKYAECLNFNPFEHPDTPVTACSEHPVYTTEVVTHLTTYCPEPTTLTFDQTTYTVTKPTTLTISDCSCTVSRPVKPTATAPVPTTPAVDCPEECTAKFNKCRIAPGSNKATCAAEYSGCLGYNPFANNGTLVTPTACSHGQPQPTKPGHPEEPSKPGHPEPSKPVQPEQPSKPGHPEPSKPVQPEQPSKPSQPEEPPKTTLEPQPSATEPVTPEEPNTPGEPESPSSVPTAAADHLSPIMGLGALAAIALL